MNVNVDVDVNVNVNVDVNVLSRKDCWFQGSFDSTWMNESYT